MPSKFRAFTFIEVVVALAIVAIALAALIRLHIFSIYLTDRAEGTTQAVLLAQEKMAQILAQSSPPLETISGIERRGAHELHWQTEITASPLPSLTPLTSASIIPAPSKSRTSLYLSDFNQADLTPLRCVRITVNWFQGRHQKHVTLTGYAADWNTP